jgi:hypothetical protein
MIELVFRIKRPSDGSEYLVRIPAGQTLAPVGKTSPLISASEVLWCAAIDPAEYARAARQRVTAATPDDPHHEYDPTKGTP